MNTHVHETSRQTAKMNRERLAVERAAVMDEEEKKALSVRENMKRLRELRLAKKAQEVRTEISTGNQPAKSKKRFR
jgi:PHD/YefM family antitoxin component YafN of YafNO toxin-antitoxin module